MENSSSCLSRCVFYYVYLLEKVHRVVFVVMGISHLHCTADGPGCKGCVLHSHILAHCLLTKGTSFGQAQVPSLSELSLCPYIDWFHFTYFSKLRTLENKTKAKELCFSKQSKLASPSVFPVFQDKLSFPLHLLRSVTLPVINQNLARDLAH